MARWALTVATDQVPEGVPERTMLQVKLEKGTEAYGGKQKVPGCAELNSAHFCVLGAARKRRNRAIGRNEIWHLAIKIYQIAHPGMRPELRPIAVRRRFGGF